MRAFVDSDVLPVINDYWDRAEFPFELVPKIAELGIVGSTIEGYGCPGLSRLAAGMVTCEMSRGDGSVNTFIGVQSGLAMGSIGLLGSEEQKQRWLPGMAALDKVGAFALTEPEPRLRLRPPRDHRPPRRRPLGAQRRRSAGSATPASPTWSSSGPATSRTGGSRPSSWRRTPDGTLPRRLPDRADHRQDRQARGLAARRRAARRAGARWTTSSPARTRSATPPGCSPPPAAAPPGSRSGHAIAAYEIALAYAQERAQFGKPIASFQLVQHKLAGMLAEITSMQLYCFRMAELQEQGRWTGPMASLAKMNHARKARQVCLDARDILGGNGLLLDHHVARHLTDMEVVHTYEGTDSIQALIVGRDITGISAFA